MEHEQLLTKYLRAKGKSKSTVATYVYMYQQFRQWAIQNQVDYEYTGHADTLDYVAYLRKRHLAQNTIQLHVAVLRYYYEALIEAGVITKNPAAYITLKSRNTRTLHNILSREQLENLYTHFEARPQRATKITAKLSAIRNKVAVGLMVFQGLDITALSRLEVKDVDVLNGTVKVRASRTCAARVLSLQAAQIVVTDRYISQTRKDLQLYFKREESKLLLITGYDKYTYANRRLVQRLRKQEPALRTVDQIRASVITHWLKQNNLREVQYMAGHKHIHSTESYQRNDMEGLQRDIDRFHPLA